ncbi:alginate O-acetyltransferase AlgF [Zavarzinia compransoris]|uniref:alginate O-acetyltransferase AlgF n=1 Tax=Zavarzinia marina TaxID=2911065 RepID=UPI001F2C01B7|nr:alginate O-acetyltransferase AlgF [Zavarzinia marina]MCF4164835.1 alginate O-acetyltransferase AlgF [Zavarzinia marina]
MVRDGLAGLAALALAGFVAGTAFAEVQLYDTGPDVVSGYVRFLNAASGDVAVSAGGAGLALPATDEGRIGRFQAVPAESEQSADVAVADAKGSVTIEAAPEEFITIAVLDGGKTLVIRDTPQDFNALKADITFLNADPACAGAVMRAGAKKTVVFKDVAPGAMARRQVNPVAAVIEAACGETPVEGVVDLGTLAAGGRYSIVVIPDRAGGHRLIGGRDERAKYD